MRRDQLCPNVSESFGISIGQHHAGAGGEQSVCRGGTDATRCACNQGDPSNERLWFRQPPELRFFECPVLDAEGLQFIESDVATQCLRSTHYIDCVTVELAGKACGGLVGCEAHASDSGYQHDYRVWIPHRRICRC